MRTERIVVCGAHIWAGDHPASDAVDARDRADVYEAFDRRLQSVWRQDFDDDTRLVRVIRDAHAAGVTQLWVLPTCPWRLTEAQVAYARAQRVDIGPRADATSAWLHVQGRHGAAIDLMFVANTSDGVWADAADEWDLYHAIHSYHEATGVVWRWSSGWTGQRLMRDLHRGTGATLLDAPGESPPPAQLPGGGDGAYNWSRRLRESDLTGKVINSFDVNGQYLAACSSLRLGVGDWRHAATHSDAELAPRDAPGYWRVSVPRAGMTPLAIPIVDARPLLRNADWLTTWISTPAMQLLREMNVAYWLDECYYWPESHCYLTPWYKRLRDARTRLMAPDAGHTLALAAVKDTYATSIGWLNLHQRRDQPELLQRPDWRDAIISQARANEWRAAWRVYAQIDAQPFAAGADCLYYLGDPAGALPPLKQGTGLGQWKRKDIAVPADHPVIARVLTSAFSGPSRVKLLQATLNCLRDGRDASAVWDRYMTRHVQMAEVRGEGMFAHVG